MRVVVVVVLLVVLVCVSRWLLSCCVVGCRRCRWLLCCWVERKDEMKSVITEKMIPRGNLSPLQFYINSRNFKNRIEITVITVFILIQKINLHHVKSVIILAGMVSTRVDHEVPLQTCSPTPQHPAPSSSSSVDVEGW